MPSQQHTQVDYPRTTREQVPQPNPSADYLTTLPSITRRKNYKAILGQAKLIARLAGFDPLDTDTALAVGACITTTDKPFVPMPLSNAAIGAKLAKSAD